MSMHYLEMESIKTVYNKQYHTYTILKFGDTHTETLSYKIMITSM